MAMFVAVLRWGLSAALFAIAMLAILIGGFLAFAAVRAPSHGAILGTAAMGCAVLGTACFYTHKWLSGLRAPRPSAARWPAGGRLVDHAFSVFLVVATLLFFQTQAGSEVAQWFRAQPTIIQFFVLGLAVAPFAAALVMVEAVWRRRTRPRRPLSAPINPNPGKTIEMEIRTASAEEMLEYEQNCSNRGPLSASLHLELTSIMEVVALTDLLKSGMWEASRDFCRSVDDHRSSDAWGEAINYRLQRDLLEQLRTIHRNYLGPDAIL